MSDAEMITSNHVWKYRPSRRLLVIIDIGNANV